MVREKGHLGVRDDQFAKRRRGQILCRAVAVSSQLEGLTNAYDFSTLQSHEVATFFFDRPLGVDWWDGAYDDYHVSDSHRFFTCLVEFFERFVEFATPYDFHQVEQGIWGIMSRTDFSLPGHLSHIALRVERGWVEPGKIIFTDLPLLVSSMRGMFENYLLNAKFEAENGFFMWWDIVGECVDDYAAALGPQICRRTKDIRLEVLKSILALPDNHCKECALHGLGHLRHEQRPEVVQTFIDEITKTGEIDDWRGEWLKDCRDGTVM